MNIFDVQVAECIMRRAELATMKGNAHNECAERDEWIDEIGRARGLQEAAKLLLTMGGHGPAEVQRVCGKDIQ